MRTFTHIRFPVVLQNHSYTILCFGLFSMFTILMAFFIFSMFGYQRVSYTYHERTVCTTSPKVLPQLFRSSADSDFRLDRQSSFAAFGLPLYAHTACVTPVTAPDANTAYRMRESILGLPGLGKPIHIQTKPFATVKANSPKNKAVPVDRPLTFILNEPDHAFIYAIQANDKTGSCSLEGRQLSCNISQLALEHAKTYDLKIVRTFDGKVSGESLRQQTETLTPITIIGSSVANAAVVYEQPLELTFQTDKPIDQQGAFKLVARDAAGAETPLSAKISVADKVLTAKLDKPLPRKQTIVARIDKLRASDGSGLTTAYTLAFTTSGGPAIKNTNIGKSSIAISQTITLNLDQAVAASQNWANLVKLAVNGQPVASRITADGARITIDPTSDFPACGKFTVTVTADVQSIHGVSGDSAWTFNSRARCAVIGSIGTSADGRAITSYRFGSGSNPIVYIGTIHGNETSAKYLLDSWLSELEANADNIPAGRSIIVIPVTNPDGFAANSRLNKNSVDLNRNFPANDWKATVTIPGGKTLPAGGGATSLSEPESQALAAFVQRERPRMLITYHAKASIIEANEAGDSMAAAYLYAKSSRYRAVSKTQNSSFQHDTTGALEDWMRDKLGLPALCIELATQSSNEFSRNKDAMWAMTKL